MALTVKAKIRRHPLGDRRVVDANLQFAGHHLVSLPSGERECVQCGTRGREIALFRQTYCRSETRKP